MFVWTFLGVFLIPGLAGVEAWPVTGWKLYSRLRHGDFWGWQILAVDRDGTERPVDVRHLSAAYHGVNYFLNDYGGLPAAEQDAACLALGEAARAQYPGLIGLAIDRVHGLIPTQPGLPPGPPAERIRVRQCDLR